FFQAEDGIRDFHVTGVQTCALPIYDDGANKLFEQLLSYRDYMQELEQRHDQVKHQLQTLIADNEVAVFEKGAISWKRSKDSVSLDNNALTKAHPELLEQFSKTRQGSRRFVILTD